MDNDLLEVRDMAMAAQKTADQALGGISSHEAVCAERYDNIKDRLKGIPRLFEIIEAGKNDTQKSIEDLRKWVYIGIGIFLTISTCLEIFHFIVK